MSDAYEALPLKYRPRTWDDLVGQAHAVLVLRSSLNKGNIFPTYIFAGTRGSGKTSAARIFAMALNCPNLTDGNPCLTCPSCAEALKGRNTDIHEIDGPSHGQVDNVRELRQTAAFQPQNARTVFIIDEAHSLSRPAFEALLKILEEPPPHVVFILATTNPERIPATIQSRSMKLDFRRHTEADVTARLSHVAEAEGIALYEEATLLIARYADGSLRDSLTVLDQLSTSHEGAITSPLVSEALGIVSGTELHTIMSAIASHDPPSLEEAVMKTLERTTEFGLIVHALTDWYRDVLRTKAGAEEYVRRSEQDRELLQAFAGALNHAQIDQAINICWDLADKVRFSSSNPRTFFLTGLYRLMLLAETPAIEKAGPPEPLDRDVPVPRKMDPTPTDSFTSPLHSNDMTKQLEAELERLASDRTP